VLLLFKQLPEHQAAQVHGSYSVCFIDQVNAANVQAWHFSITQDQISAIELSNARSARSVLATYARFFDMELGPSAWSRRALRMDRAPESAISPAAELVVQPLSSILVLPLHSFRIATPSWDAGGAQAGVDTPNASLRARLRSRRQPVRITAGVRMRHIAEIVDFQKTRHGDRLLLRHPKGVLLGDPPGTGKTLPLQGGGR